MAPGRFGWPDVGLVTPTEMLESARTIVRASGLPVLVDGDTGYGGDANIARTIADLAQAGAAAVMIEDQTWPSGAIKPSGTLEDWKREVAARCVDNPLLIVGVSLALSGPLLELLGIDGGGLHMRGDSSCGKTTVLVTALSVWSGPFAKQSWRATANGLEGMAGRANATLVALDELGEVAPHEVEKAVYMLANGQGKARADHGGGLRPVTMWRVPVFSSGEVSLAVKLDEAHRRKMDGHEVRLIDLRADARTYGAFDNLHDLGSGAEFSDRLKQAVAVANGTAGPAFVEAILRHLEGVRDACRMQMEQMRAKFLSRCGFPADGQVERVIQRLALTAVAGELATRLGVTGWQSGTATRAVEQVLDDWAEAREDGTDRETRNALDRVQHFLVAHAARFPAAGDPVVPDQAGRRDGAIFYISVEAWEEIHEGHDKIMSAKRISEAGYVAKRERKGLTVKSPNLTTMDSRERAYAIDARILDRRRPAVDEE